MTRAKSLLEVRDGLSFLDIIARQVLALRERYAGAARLPLILMDSFRTRDGLARGARGARPAQRRPGPRLRAEPGAEAPGRRHARARRAGRRTRSSSGRRPGTATSTRRSPAPGCSRALLEQGYRWAFVSNADNLGATLDPRILAWIAREEVPFLMEVADRTAADRKGGHLARSAPDGGLVLREVAQTPEEDLDAFQDITRHRFFNTNTIWLDLETRRRRPRRATASSTCR